MLGWSPQTSSWFVFFFFLRESREEEIKCDKKQEEKEERGDGLVSLKAESATTERRNWK